MRSRSSWSAGRRTGWTSPADNPFAAPLRTAVKNVPRRLSSSLKAITRPIAPALPPRRTRAAEFASYPRSRASRSTAAVMAGSTFVAPESTRAAVARDTPAASATSTIVGLAMLEPPSLEKGQSSGAHRERSISRVGMMDRSLGREREASISGRRLTGRRKCGPGKWGNSRNGSCDLRSSDVMVTTTRERSLSSGEPDSPPALTFPQRRGAVVKIRTVALPVAAIGALALVLVRM